MLQMRCACALMCLCAVYPYVVCLCLRVRGLWGLSEKAVHEFFAVEYLQLVDSFSHADVAYRDFELVADADHHAAFGRAVELRDRERSHLCRLRELF